MLFSKFSECGLKADLQKVCEMPHPSLVDRPPLPPRRVGVGDLGSFCVQRSIWNIVRSLETLYLRVELEPGADPEPRGVRPPHLGVDLGGHLIKDLLIILIIVWCIS